MYKNLYVYVSIYIHIYIYLYDHPVDDKEVGKRKDFDLCFHKESIATLGRIGLGVFQPS